MIRCSFQQLQQLPKVKAKGTIKCMCLPIVVTQHSQIMFFIKRMIMYNFTLKTSFGFKTLFFIFSFFF